jgi:hypothetical protein
VLSVTFIVTEVPAAMSTVWRVMSVSFSLLRVLKRPRTQALVLVVVGCSPMVSRALFEEGDTVSAERS